MEKELNLDVCWDFFSKCKHKYEYKNNDTEFDWQNCKDCDLCKKPITEITLGGVFDDIIRDVCFHVWHQNMLINFCVNCGKVLTIDEKVTYKKCFKCFHEFV